MTSPATAAEPMSALRLHGLVKTFGSTRVLDGVDLDLRAGERLALIGPNGAGKTTLFNLVNGTLRPTAGTVWLHGVNVTGQPPWRLQQRGLGRSFQVTSLFTRLTVRDHLRLAALRSLGHGRVWWRSLAGLRAVNARADEMLELLDLTVRATQPAGVLTHADQRALELGMALAGRPRVLLLDEPTAGMSRAETEVAIERLARVTRGMAVLLVEHDMDAVFRLADRIAVLERGRIIACAPPDHIAADPVVQQAYLGARAGASAGAAQGQPC